MIKFVAPAPAVANAAPDPVFKCVASSPASTCAAPVTEHASSSPTAANAAPVMVITFVAPAGTCAASEYAPAAAFATPTPVSDYVDRAEATFEISGAGGGGDAHFPAEVQPVVDAVVPESTDVTERWRDADMSESMSDMSEDAAETSTGLELDVVRVRVHRVQALTSLRLWRLEELLEEWESMGVIRRDDTWLWVSFCPSIADALNDEDCWWQRGKDFPP